MSSARAVRAVMAGLAYLALGLAVEAATLPSGVSGVVSTNPLSSQRLGIDSSYSAIYWPKSLSPGSPDSPGVSINSFLETWTVGRGGSFETAGFVNIVSTQDEGLLITAPIAGSARHNFTLDMNMSATSAGFAGAACLTYDIQASTSSIAVTLQDEQGFVKTGTTNDGLFRFQLNCTSSGCTSFGVLALNETNGTYLFLMANSGLGPGWAAINYTLLPASNPVCLSAMQQPSMPSVLERSDLKIGMLNQPAIVYPGVFRNLRSEFNPGMSKLVGAFWNSKCFSASLLTLAANGQPPVPIRLYVFDLVNLQKHLANLLALPVATCVAGGTVGQFNQTCEISKTTLNGQAIFVVAFYDPLINVTLPKVDYIFEILTAAYATDDECRDAPTWLLSAGAPASPLAPSPAVAPSNPVSASPSLAPEPGSPSSTPSYPSPPSPTAILG